MVRSINKEICCKYNIIPLKENENNIYILTSGLKVEEFNYLKFICGKNIVCEKVTCENLKKIQSEIFNNEDENLEKHIIFKAIDDNASDIHFEPQSNSVNIRCRIHGILILMRKVEKEEYVKILSKIKLMSGMDIAEKRKPQDGKISIEYKNKKYDLRVSTIPVINGEKIVIRILYGENFSYTLENLGFTEEKIKIIKKIISVKNGIVIICGPTGSGKSSTLYTILKELDSKTLNITTLEDPIEIQMESINQMSLNKKLGITFASGLRSILRQDPDVIMIGEIRDEETAQIAVSSSITGHKVYSTIHCKSPKEVFMRLENMGVKPYLIKEGLVGIISQRLVKILCRKCKVVDNEKSFKNHKVFKALGCDCCKFTGYEGRKVVSSVCFLSSNIDYACTDSSDEEFLSNKSMKEDIENLLINGMISYKDYVEFIEGERLDE